MNKRLELTWIGKDKQEKVEPRILIENKEISYGEQNNDNFLIHGDNLLGLKALESRFTGKIKCIYIDPPFNTGSAFEHYDDNLEHSIWLSLMKERLTILYKLLSDDGSIWINLDDSEASYCKIICDEIFGRNNYLNEIIVATNKSFGFKSTADTIFKQANHILLYCKNKSLFKFNEEYMYVEKGYDDQYKFVFQNTDRPEAEWTWISIKDAIAIENGYDSFKEAKKEKFDVEKLIPEYAIKHAEKVFRTASVTGGALAKRKDTIELSKTEKNKVIRHPNDDMDYMFIGGSRVIYYKERLRTIEGKICPAELITDIWNDISVEGLAAEGGVDFPKGKKPEKLIYRILNLCTQPGDYVLDSFLGSGTTCAVAHKMNRKWIGIELGKHAYTHCVKRINSVIDGKEYSGITKLVDWQGGGGYKFYELAPTLINEDVFGEPIINKEYNPEMLASAVALHEGFEYSPNKEVFWKQSKGNENSFLYVTTQFLGFATLDRINEEMSDNEYLIIACTSYDESLKNKYKNIMIKKIPEALLKKCKYNIDNYNFNIIDEESEE